jgi:hypothetical protein
LDTIEANLTNARDDPPPGTFNIIRIAAHAGVLLTQKYLSLMDDCEVYAIAISECYFFPSYMHRSRASSFSHVATSKVGLVP